MLTALQRSKMFMCSKTKVHDRPKTVGVEMVAAASDFRSHSVSKTRVHNHRLKTEHSRRY